VTPSQQLGERLADARKRARLTQAEVAERLGVARTTLVAIEKGERRPSDAELVRLGEIDLYDEPQIWHALTTMTKRIPYERGVFETVDLASHSSMVCLQTSSSGGRIRGGSRPTSWGQ